MKRNCCFKYCFYLFFGFLLFIQSPSFVFAQSGDSSNSNNEKKESSVVTIQSAQKTSNKKDELTGQDIIVFTGDVVLSVKKGNTTIQIESQEVTFNRERSTLYATGGVSFSQKSSSNSSENLTANSLYFNTETLEGVFDDGRVTQESSSNINLPTGTSLVVASELFGRENSGTVTFKNGTLTFCDDENPHWKISASRIWLLPGSEFSFFNALLYVGQLPVLYLPFFYYPKDEMIFNPVFGYRPREGYYTQTSTYLIGRKPLQSNSEDDGLFSFMRTTELKKQERDGLFLRNLEEKDVMPSHSLKILADYYSNLGAMVGTEGSFKPKNIITDISFGTYLGFSNTLFPMNDGKYTVFSPTGQKYYNSSLLFGKEVPFRYYAFFKMSLSKRPFSISLSMPFYSDSYFVQDFMNREESMDWINFLLENPALISSSNTTTTNSAITTFNWNISGSISKPNFLSVLSPYIQDISISSISATLNFSSRDNKTVDTEEKNVSTSRKFFFPISIYPIKMTAKISGTLFARPYSKKNATAKNTPVSGLIAPNELNSNLQNKEASSDTIITDDKVESQLETQAELQLGAKEEEQEKITDEIQEDSNLEDILPPSYFDENAFGTISISKDSLVTLGEGAYSLTYSITPTINTEITYDSSKYNSPSDVDLSKTNSTYLYVSVPVSLKSQASWRSKFISLSNSLDFLPTYQEHPHVSDETYPEGSNALSSLLKTDYMARKLNLDNTNSLTYSPFVFSDHFKGTSLSWNTKIKIIRTEFLGNIDNPDWDYITPDWDEDSITTHNLSFVLASAQAKNVFSQTFTLTASLPPLTESYGFKLAFKFPYVTSVVVSTKYKRKSKTDDTWVLEPLVQDSSLSLFSGALTLSQSYKYNLEDNLHESFALSMKAYGATLQYNMAYTTSYRLDSTQGWIANSDKEFLPLSLKVSYTKPTKKYYAWGNRIEFAPTLATQIALDLIRPTSSFFTFAPGISFKINSFLDLSFSAESRNDVIFRYVQDLVGFDPQIPGEENIFKDLLNSFAFSKKSLRESSGFKLKKLNITLSHDLHDWVLNSKFTLEPRIIKDQKPYYVDFSPYFTMSVIWRPMSSIKTTIEDKYGVFALNPSE